MVSIAIPASAFAGLHRVVEPSRDGYITLRMPQVAALAVAPVVLARIANTKRITLISPPLLQQRQQDLTTRMMS